MKIRPTVLIVDDELLIRWSLGERLNAEGYSVLEADTGTAAVEMLRQGVDLVLLDYRLPDVDGVSVLREIKQFDPNISVILLSAYASLETAAAALNLGAYSVADKPFNLDDVAQTVGAALGETRQKQAFATPGGVC